MVTLKATVKLKLVGRVTAYMDLVKTQLLMNSFFCGTIPILFYMGDSYA